MIVRCKSLLIIITMSAFPIAATAAEECDLPLADIVRARDFGLAYYCSELRLNEDQADVVAMLVAARAAQELGQLDIALDLARRSRQFPLTRSQRFASFLISGVAAAGEGDSLTSKILLRRGANLAQNDVELGIIGAAMAQVRARSPWSYGLSFNLTPSTNVNGGTIIENSSDSEDSRAQPGIGYGLNASITHRTKLSTQLVWENKTFSDARFYDGLGQNNYTLGYTSSLRYLPNNRIPILLIASLTFENRGLANELGGPVFGNYSPYYSQTSFRLESHIVPKADHSLVFTSSYTAREYEAFGPAEVTQFGASYGFPITNNISTSISGYWENTDSTIPFPFLAKETKNIAIGLLLDLENYPISFSGKLSYATNSYKVPYFFEGYRDDERITLDIGVTPKNLQWYGFRPTFGLSMSENTSTIDRFTTSEIKVYTRISSIF